MQEDWFLTVIVLIGVSIVINVIGRVIKLTKTQTIPGQYQQAPALFTQAEQSFLGVLTQAAGAEVRVFGKVRVADVINPKDGLNPSARQVAFNKISSKHFDFVLCDSSTLKVLCVIELDDASHDSAARKLRDQFLDSTCQSAELPLLHVKAASTYSIHEIADKVAMAVEQHTEA